MRQRTVLGQVVVEVQLAVILNHGPNYLVKVVFQRATHPAESKYLLKELITHLLLIEKRTTRLFLIEQMLVKEAILAVLVRTVKESISVDDIIPVGLSFIIMIAILTIFKVIFVALVHLTLLLFRWQKRLYW